MPLKTYCTDANCSFPIEYSLEKPSFCPKCGKNLNEHNISIANNKRNNTRISQPIIEQEPEIDVNPEDFKVSIESFGDNKGVKFGELAEQQKTGFSRMIPKKINVKKTIASILEEAKKPAKVDVTDGGTE